MYFRSIAASLYSIWYAKSVKMVIENQKILEIDKMISSTDTKTRRLDVTTIQIKSYSSEWMSG